MVSTGSGKPSVTSVQFSTLVVVCVLASCIRGAQCCMPMMPMMMPMMEQAQNAMMFQASSSMFKTFFEDFGQPLFKLHVGGATHLVWTVLMQMSPFPFAPEDWFDIAIQLGNLVVSASYATIGFAEAIFRTIISIAQVNYYDKLGGLIRMLYSLRLTFSPTVSTTASPALAGREADQRVALLLRNQTAGKGEERADEGRSRREAAEDCVLELFCGLWTSRPNTSIWHSFWNIASTDEEQDDGPPSVPTLCAGRDEEFLSCYSFVDDVMNIWQTELEYYRRQYYNGSRDYAYQDETNYYNRSTDDGYQDELKYYNGSRDDGYQNETIPPWTWDVFG